MTAHMCISYFHYLFHFERNFYGKLKQTSVVTWCAFKDISWIILCTRKKGKERRDWTTEDEWNNQFALIVPSAFFSSSRRSKFVFVHHPTNHWKSFIIGFSLYSYIFVQIELTLNCWLFSIVQDRRAPTSAMTPMGHQACWTSGALTATTNARAPRTECEYWVWWLDVCMRSAWKVWRSRFRWKKNECEGRNSSKKNVKLRKFVLFETSTIW